MGVVHYGVQDQNSVAGLAVVLWPVIRKVIGNKRPQTIQYRVHMLGLHSSAERQNACFVVSAAVVCRRLRPLNDNLHQIIYRQLKTHESLKYVKVR